MKVPGGLVSGQTTGGQTTGGQTTAGRTGRRGLALSAVFVLVSTIMQVLGSARERRAVY
jgi:hypothetical protein